MTGSPLQHRLRPLDRMRGIVMVLMVSDHASEAFNAARPALDSALIPGWDAPLDTGQFLFRWLSHLCAPAFLFLAGTSLALSVERKRSAGAPGRRIDRDLLMRGALILCVDLLLINWFWEPGSLLLQVMYAIGLSMVCMVALRRLPDAGLLAFALASLTVGEWTRSGALLVPAEWLPAANALLISAGLLPLRFLEFQYVLPVYPVLPWCGMMALGWVFGRALLRWRAAGGGEVDRARVARTLGVGGVLLLGVFLVLRGLNGFGNLGLPRTDGSLVQWLHVSKYPPSLTFAALELGLMSLILAGLFRFERAGDPDAGSNHPVLVFGQTAFFFYVAHILLLEVGAQASGLHHEGTLGHALVAFALVLVPLYPLCLGYRRLKARHPRSVLRFF